MFSVVILVVPQPNNDHPKLINIPGLNRILTICHKKIEGSFVSS